MFLGVNVNMFYEPSFIHVEFNAQQMQCLIFIVILTGHIVTQATYLKVCLCGRFQRGLTEEGTATLNFIGTIAWMRGPE